MPGIHMTGTVTGLKRDERGYETTYEYDSMNRLVSFTDPMGGVWSYTYDPAGNRLSQTNPRGDTIATHMISSTGWKRSLIRMGWSSRQTFTTPTGI